MKVAFVAGFGPIVRDLAASRAFYGEGLGIALDSYLSVAAAVLLPLAAVVNRIAHEERTLRRELGEAYEVYSSRTWRLVPGVW